MFGSIHIWRKQNTHFTDYFSSYIHCTCFTACTHLSCFSCTFHRPQCNKCDPHCSSQIYIRWRTRQAILTYITSPTCFTFSIGIHRFEHLQNFPLLQIVYYYSFPDEIRITESITNLSCVRMLPPINLTSSVEGKFACRTFRSSFRDKYYKNFTENSMQRYSTFKLLDITEFVYE